MRPNPFFTKIIISGIPVLFLLLMSKKAFSQTQGAIPIERFYSREVQRSVASMDSSNHTGIQPYFKNRFDLTKIVGYSKDSARYYELFQSRIMRDHLVEVRSEDFHLGIDPLLDFTYGWDLADTSAYKDSVKLYNNTRGLIIQGEIGNKVAFVTGFYENQSFFPRYLRDITNGLGVVPGMGRIKVFKKTGFDYSMSFGSVTYSPTKWLTLQMGYTKHFVGYGYRSLLLSDAAFNAPSIEANMAFFKGKVQYSTIYSSLQTLDRMPLGEVPEALYKRKGGSFHYLSWSATPRIQLGLFEGIVWQRWDSTGVKALPVSAFIPLIGLNTAVQGFDGKNNVLVGVNAQIKLTKHSQVYGQLALDDPSSSRMGWQIGANYFDCVIKNLDFQTEWNHTSDYMYASKYALQSYSHYNQPLGLASGAGVDEWIGIVNYRYGRLFAKLKYNIIQQSGGSGGNWQSNPDLPQETLVLVAPRTIHQLDASVGAYASRKTNLQLVIGYIDRVDGANTPIPNLHTGWIYFGVRANLHNRYSDF